RLHICNGAKSGSNAWLWPRSWRARRSRFAIQGIESDRRTAAADKGDLRAGNQSTADLHNQLKTQSEALRQLETAGTFDAAAYKAAAVALGNTQAELMTAHATAFNQIYNQVLTQDQRDKLKQMEANHPQGPPPGGGLGPRRPE